MIFDAACGEGGEESKGEDPEDTKKKARDLKIK